ncbi:hypothetical protein ACFLYR_08710 [Chloroflexota bacterium]
MAILVAVALGLILLFGLAPTEAASPDEVKRSRVNIPGEGTSGDWVLAKNSDIRHLAVAADGTLYANGQGLSCTLYKSTNESHGWSVQARLRAT